jgi:hypothetical protein
LVIEIQRVDEEERADALVVTVIRALSREFLPFLERPVFAGRETEGFRPDEIFPWERLPMVLEALSLFTTPIEAHVLETALTALDSDGPEWKALVH